MRKQILKIALAGGLALALPTASLATIIGSPHDFSGQSWNTTGEICKTCHIPHNAAAAGSAGPLWNHTITSSTFTPYSSDTLNATVGQPVGVSKACLSCHDGTVALNAFGGNGVPVGGDQFLTGSKNLGTDLSNDHPISFTFDTALQTADGSLKDPTTLPATLRLFAGKVQCATCHDVHKSRGDAPTQSKLLVINNSGSALCLTCHNK